MFNPFKIEETGGPFAKGPGMAEKMVAQMLGFTPEEMAQTLTDFRNSIVAVAETMARIEAKLDAALAIQEGNENVRLIGNDGSASDGPVRRSRKPGNGADRHSDTTGSVE